MMIQWCSLRGWPTHSSVWVARIKPKGTYFGDAFSIMPLRQYQQSKEAFLLERSPFPNANCAGVEPSHPPNGGRRKWSLAPWRVGDGFPRVLGELMLGEPAATPQPGYLASGIGGERSHENRHVRWVSGLVSCGAWPLGGCAQTDGVENEVRTSRPQTSEEKRSHEHSRMGCLS